MLEPGKRHFLSRGKKGYLNAVGPQARFIVFLLAVLIIFTIILRIFQKLAEILQLPIFLPLSLITLLLFIGVAGTIYSHKFVGPLVRIRKAIERLAEGDIAISLRLRESDDPMMKDLVKAISRLCEHSRNSHTLIHDTVQDLVADMATLQEKIQQGADKSEILQQIQIVKKRQETLDKAVQSSRKV
jgi:methyl-accepting chemotaxis protein